jgi:uncharacterized transporter YbjL
MNFVFMIGVFAVHFFIDFPTFKRAGLKEKIIYVLLFLGALTYASLYEARITSASVVTLISRAVAFFRGIHVPPQFY